MTIQEDGKNSERIDTEQDNAEVSDLLSHHRRRATLYYLANNGGPICVNDVAEQIARLEEDYSTDHHERICTSLIHTHLPKLEEAGIIRYDTDQDVIEWDDEATRNLSDVSSTTLG